MPFWDKNYISGGGGGGGGGAPPDNRFPRPGLRETVEEILKELVGGIKGYETRILASQIESDRYQWTVHIVPPRNQALAIWNDYLSRAREDKSKKEEEMAGYMEQFKAMSSIAAHIHLLRKSGPVKEYRMAEKELEKLSLNVTDLETKVKELGSFGYWVQEFPPHGKYAVYPYPSVLEITTSYSTGMISSPPKIAILLSPQPKDKDLILFHNLSAELGKRVHEEWPWVDVVLGPSDRSLLYTSPLAEARAREAAKKELEKKPAEKKPKGRTTWP